MKAANIIEDGRGHFTQNSSSNVFKSCCDWQ